MIEFKFPDVGEGIAEGEIVKWRVSVGDRVKQDQVIAEVETDKAVVELPSPQAGTILEIRHKEGDTVKVGEVLVVIGEPGEKAAKAGAAQIVEKVQGQGKVSRTTATAPQSTAVKKVSASAFVKEVKSDSDRGSVVGELQTEGATLPPAVDEPLEKIGEHPHAVPSVRRLARELNVDLGKLKGTGIGGRITEQDVRDAKGKSGQAASGLKVVKKYDMFGYLEHVPLKGIRKATAERMELSRDSTVPVTHMDEADVTELAGIREKEKGKYEKKGLHLTYMPFVVKAVIAALKKHPYLNSTMDPENGEIVLKKYYNIGIAVDIEGGLLVPVLKIADSKNIAQIAKELQELAGKAKERKLDLADMQGGTFTITNVGVLGGVFATPVINYPECAILATGKVIEKPVVVGGKIVVRRTMPLSLTFDHKVVDGAEAARFMNDVIAGLQDPEGLLIGDSGK